MADDLNGQNNRNHPPYRAAKMLDVFDTVVFDADDVGKYDDRQRTGCRGIQAGGWGEKARHQSDQIGTKNIDKDRGSQRQQPAAFFTRNIHHEFFNSGDDDFKEILPL